MARGVMALEGTSGRGNAGKLFFAISLTGSLWCIGYGLMGIADTDIAAYIFRGVGLFGLFTCSPLLVMYLMNLSGIPNHSVKLIDFILAFGALISFFSMVMPGAVTFIDVPYGRYYIENDWSGRYIFLSYIIFILFVWLMICILWKASSRYKRERRMADLALAAAVIVSVGMVVEMTLSLWGQPAVPISPVTSFVAVSIMHMNFRQYKDVSISGSRMSEFIFRKVSIPVVTFDDRFVITECNEDACEYLGAKKEELIGSLISEWIIGIGNTDIERIRSEFTNLSKEFEADVMVKRTDSMCSVKCAVDYDRFKEVISVIAILNDQTVAEKNRKRVEDSEKEVRIANSARETFFRGMNSNIVNVVKNNIEFASGLLLSDCDEKTAQELYDVIASNSELLSVMENMLDAARMESGQLEIKNEEYDLEALLLEVIKDAAHKIDESKVRFITQISPQIPKILYGDASRIRQMLNILLDNAAKYTSEGYIMLRAQCRVRYGKVSLTMAVSDTGTGISEDDLEGIFDYFGQTNKWESDNIASGLDLSICRGLIKLMGGEMTVRSAPGKGTTFNLSFEQTAQTETAVIPYSDYTDNVLLIEENQHSADAMEKLIGELGIRCVTVVGHDFDETMLPDGEDVTLVIIRAGILGRMRHMFEMRYSKARFLPVYSYSNYLRLSDEQEGICGILAFSQIGRYLR